LSDRSLRDQLQRASVSTMSNIAEGFERDTAKDFLRFLTTARASNAEVRSLLYIARDIDLIDDHVFQNLMTAADETSRLVSGFRKSIEH
jgi:four helix bundle protein